MDTIGKRLRAERTRLGFNIRDFAEKGGVGSGTQSRYENDQGVPDSDYLNRVSELGAEIFWIMRGSEEDEVARDKRVAAYSPEIREMVANYERCPPEIQQSLRTIAAASAGLKDENNLPSQVHREEEG
ncbi:helix-turn-helix transcriptional regulator [Zoogloea sp.]|uniref:helix-turn-helix domain-containing protein n=1 Tax=Zoogloea sp. TaxID=49181 RepID=UPI00260A1D9A|nr:helix-turn-helix transcriptional regulator [Zoogloea sp.]